MATTSVLNELYYDEKHPAAFSGAKKLHKYAKEILPSIKLGEVKDWLSGEITYTLHKQARRKFERNPIHVRSIDEQWQADLTFLKEFESVNNGYRYILTVIDCFSKYAWAKALKTKTSAEVQRAFESIFQERKPVMIQTDKGREFESVMIKKFFKKNNVIHFTSNSPEIKCAIVERFNRTLKGKMFKLFTSTGRRRWITKLPDLIHAYNNSIHRSTNYRPVEVSFENQHHVYKNLYKEPIIGKPKLKEGDTVRQRYIYDKFDRGFYPNWTDTTFEVKDHIAGKKPRYKVDDTKRRHYPEELQKINPGLYRIEYVKDVAIRRKRLEYLVKWTGYSDHYNSWIPARDVTPVGRLRSGNAT